ISGTDKVIYARIVMAQKVIDVFNALAAEPGGIRCGKALLGARGNIVRNQFTHGLSQDDLAITLRLSLVQAALRRFVFINLWWVQQVTQFVTRRNFGGEFHQLVIRKWYARLDGVSHAYFVFDDKQAVQKCLKLEVE